MSGFFAVFSRAAAPIDPGLLARAEHALAHRGADARGYASFGRAALGQVSRWVTPEQVGSQPPFQLPDPGLSLVGDIRLDNREELIEALGARNAHALPDEQLVLLAYERWKDACVAHLLGDFAFAVWDAPAQRLFVARDHFGMRPVYYAETGAYCLVASQASALFAAPELVRQIDDLRVATFLSRLHEDKERSFYRGVSRLKPGSIMSVSAERGLERRVYWQLDPERRELLPNSRAYTEKFLELFRASVRSRLRTRGPVGVLLSGGLDSSGALGVMRELMPHQEIPTYSARFPDFPFADEGDYLELLRPPGGPEAHELVVDRMSPLRGVEAVCSRLDEPLFGPNTFVYSALASRADERGLGALLDGIDGDSTVEHGWQYPNVLWHQGRVRRAWREVRAMQRREGHPLKTMLRARMFALELDLAMRLYVLHAPAALIDHLPGIMSRDLAERTRWFDHARAETHALLRPVTDFNRLHHRNLTSGTITVFVEQFDHTSQVYKVDHRHPYFDRRLLEFCLALPPEQRLHDGWDRVIQRRAFDGLVPKQIQFRHSKSVWTQVFERQLAERDADQLRALSEHPDLAAFVDVVAMRRGIDDMVRGKTGTLVMELWLAASVARWLGVTKAPMSVAT